MSGIAKTAWDAARGSESHRESIASAGGFLPVGMLLPAEAIDRIAERAAEMVLARSGGGTTSPYLTVSEAAEYLRAKPQRVYDLLSSGRLTRFKDGRRVLVLHAELDAHVARPGRKPVASLLPPAPQTRTANRLAA
jgi:excisionase family DNA binding protein